MTELTDPSNTALRNQIRTKKIINLIYEGHDWTSIAREMGVGRNTLYAIMRTPEVRELLRLESDAIKTKLQELLKELSESTSPQDKRTAVVEMGKMSRHLEDKLLPSLSAVAHVNVDTQKERDHLFLMLQKDNEVLRNLKPYHRDAFWKKFSELFPNEMRYEPREIRRANLDPNYDEQEALYTIVE